MAILKRLRLVNMDAAAWIGLIGGVVGVLGGLISICTYVRDSSPDLRIEAPYRFFGQAAEGQSTMLVLLRISNRTKADCTIYFDHIDEATVFSSGGWHSVQTPLVLTTKVSTDLTPELQKLYGLDQVGFFNRFTDNTVQWNRPITGYIAFTHSNKKLLEEATEIRITVKDSGGKRRTLECSLRDV